MITTLKKQFKEIERMCIKNIANSLLQLEFHKEGTDEEIMQYYGWTEPLKEEEREKLIIDTQNRLKSEQRILQFIKNHKKELYNKYGNKNPLGYFNIIEERPNGESASERSQHQDAQGEE